jgi:hypothetical protein
VRPVSGNHEGRRDTNKSAQSDGFKIKNAERQSDAALDSSQNEEKKSIGRLERGSESLVKDEEFADELINLRT